MSNAEQTDKRVINLPFAVDDTVWLMHENQPRKAAVEKITIERTSYRRDREQEPTLITHIVLQVTSTDNSDSKRSFVNKTIAVVYCFPTKQALLESL
jgi:hypothetical protein